MWLGYFISEQYVQKYAWICILKLPIKTISVVDIHIIRWRSKHWEVYFRRAVEVSGRQGS